MSPKKQDNITEVEKESWETYIDKKFKVVYWIHGALAASILMIFLGVTGPLTVELMNLKGIVKEFITKDQAFDRFLTKDVYHSLQKDEHISDIEAIQNPQNADVIYMRQNSRESEKLGVSYNRGATTN